MWDLATTKQWSGKVAYNHLPKTDLWGYTGYAIVVEVYSGMGTITPPLTSTVSRPHLWDYTCYVVNVEAV